MTGHAAAHQEVKKNALHLSGRRFAHPEGVEPTTSGSVDRRSIQLSYGCLGTRYLALGAPVSRGSPPESGFRRNNQTTQKVVTRCSSRDSHAMDLLA